MSAGVRAYVTARRTRDNMAALLIELAGGFLERELVSTVSGDQHDHSKPMRHQAASEVERDRAQRFGGHRERPGSVHMLVGVTDPNRWRQHCTQTISDHPPYEVSEDGVGPERQVTPCCSTEPNGMTTVLAPLWTSRRSSGAVISSSVTTPAP